MNDLPADRVLRAAKGLLAKKVRVPNQAPSEPERIIGAVIDRGSDLTDYPRLRFGSRIGDPNQT